MPSTIGVNEARLKLEPTAGSVQYNLYQRGQAIRAGAPTAGQTAVGGGTGQRKQTLEDYAGCGSGDVC